MFLGRMFFSLLSYPSKGSVYFDTVKFHNTEGHDYGKLRPDAVGNIELLSEGEGALSSGEIQDRKTEKDFALWKVRYCQVRFLRGRHRSQESPLGTPLGERVDLVGISSALLWLRKSSVQTWMYTVVAVI
jgi:cysteinyl-tRNA synthetase